MHISVCSLSVKRVVSLWKSVCRLEVPSPTFSQLAPSYI